MCREPGEVVITVASVSCKPGTRYDQVRAWRGP